MHRCRKGFLAVAFFSLAINLLYLTAPLYMLQIFDRVLTGQSVHTLVYLTLIAITAFLCLWGLDVVRGRIMIRIGTWLDRRVGGDVLAASVDVTNVRRAPSIDPLRDLGSLRSFLAGPGIFPLFDAPWTPVFLVAVFLLHPMLGWIGLVGAALLFMFAVANDLATRQTMQSAGLISSKALDEAQAAAGNADVIHAMGMMSGIILRWARTTRASLEEQARASRMSGFVTASSKFVRQVLQVAILGVGALLVIANELSPGGMIAASILMARALSPLEQAIATWRNAMGAKFAYSQIHKLLEFSSNSETQAALPRPKGKLTVEGMSYAHPGAKEPLLRGLSFKLHPGESLGLIGPSAAGKTTLAKILVGIHKPQLGHARLDGVDLADWDAIDRGQHIGYLPQDIELFTGTVKDNIARLTDCGPEAVYDAAEVAGVHQDILALPKGYETEVGVGGVALSGGQRQRIGLARAVFGKPKLVVLDEPNSNLDVAGESALLEALSALKSDGTTVVIIAHRPSVLRNVDKILVLRDGVIEMIGPRDRVFERVCNPVMSNHESNGASAVRPEEVANV